MAVSGSVENGDGQFSGSVLLYLFDDYLCI